MLSERQKLILQAEKSDFGWKTVDQFTQYELADNEKDGKKIRGDKEQAKKVFKSTTSKKTYQPIFIAQSSFQLVMLSFPVFWKFFLQ